MCNRLLHRIELNAGCQRAGASAYRLQRPSGNNPFLQRLPLTRVSQAVSPPPPQSPPPTPAVLSHILSHTRAQQLNPGKRTPGRHSRTEYILMLHTAQHAQKPCRSKHHTVHDGRMRKVRAVARWVPDLNMVLKIDILKIAQLAASKIIRLRTLMISPWRMAR